ncbi:MAG: hypothetical protein IPN62_06625 [Flavobacteriales bacterium]|jgi:hypothetical protein|nr:hypothetical protein [Flavobacteriales bacterium]MBP7449375.1 hypothetical protein [Flavobacteriales bacterium]
MFLFNTTLFTRIGAIGALLCSSISAWGQCTWYTIAVNDGTGAPDVTWTLIDAMGVPWASGSAPWNEDVCLPDGCYTLIMYDSNSDGWDDIDWVIEDWTGDFDFDTNLGDGPHGSDVFVLGEDQPCDPAVIGASCPAGTNTLQFIVSNGSAPIQVGWSLTLNGTELIQGGANFNDTLCLDELCYVLQMTDAGANGWQGATYTLKYFGGATLYTGTCMGAADSVVFAIGGVDCSSTTGGGGGGNGGGSGGTCSATGDPTGDCPTVVCVCDPYTFPITPSGFGSINEIPDPGTTSNPAFGGPIQPAPWGDTNYGCLYAGELNSSWLRFTVGSTGTLGFSLGAGGTQAGFYDWAMWLYSGPGTCSSINNDLQAPVRCLWNAVSWGGTGLANSIPPGGDPGNYGPELPVIAGQQYIICLSNYSYVTTTVPLDFFGTAEVQCGTVLPMELLGFSAAAEGQDVRVQWTTATERDNDHFEVERSTDMVQWDRAGMLYGSGSSGSVHHYELIDIHPGGTVLYYRLKQVDTNGSFDYSDVRTVELDKAGTRELWPQPSTGTFMVASATLEGLTLVDALGQVVRTTISPGSITGTVEIRMDTPTPGWYILLFPDEHAAARVIITSNNE